MNISQKIVSLLSVTVLLCSLAPYSILNSAAADSSRQEEAFEYMVNAIKETKENKISIEDFSQKLENFITQGNDIDSRYQGNKGTKEITLLHNAAYYGVHKVIQLLFNKNAQIDLKSSNGITPLYCAASGGHTEIVEMFLARDTEVNSLSNDEWSSLHSASFGGHTETVKTLLHHNAYIHQISKSGCSSLYLAAEQGKTKVIEILLDNGALIDQQAGMLTWTSLHRATVENHKDSVEILLDKGAQVNLQDRDGCSPLYIAVAYGHIEIAKILLTHKAQIDLVHKSGYSPLWIAVENNHGEIVQLLLDNGAQANLKVRGRSLLHRALFLGKLPIMKQLLKEGADLNIPNNSGKTPLECAGLHNNKEAIAAIKTELALRKKELSVKERQKELTTDLLALCELEEKGIAAEAARFAQSPRDKRLEEIEQQKKSSEFICALQ